jgi:hypothetical protein
VDNVQNCYSYLVDYTNMLYLILNIHIEKGVDRQKFGLTNVTYGYIIFCLLQTRHLGYNTGLYT